MERRLSAVFAADMVGYSRLVETDEIGTLERQKAHRKELIDPAFQDFHGRIIKEMGDGLLVEFPSVVEAVQCAVAIQRAMLRQEDRVPEDRRITYRIGINLGDIIVDGDDIHGDGVNVAARLEALAEAGGICISGTAYDHLRSTIDVGYESLGEVRVKNIKRPIRAYRVLTDTAHAGTVLEKSRRRFAFRAWAAMVLSLLLIVGAGGWWWFQQPDFEPADLEKFAFDLPDVPSIAVLPFDNLSGEKTKDYLSDGLTESIIATLAAHPRLLVISRNSSFTFKGQAVKVQTVAQDLGVRYVLEGSVQHDGGTLRVTARLIDALNGQHVWAKQYDGDLSTDGLLSIQDGIIKEIFSGVNAELISGTERTARALADADGDLETYKLMIQAENEYVKFTPDGNEQAEHLNLQILDRNPDSLSALVGLAWIDWFKVTAGLTSEPDKTLQEAREHANRAIQINPKHAQAHMVAAWIDLRKRKYEAAIAGANTAMEIQSGDGRLHALAAWLYAASGHPDLGNQHFKDALRLEPLPPSWVPSSYSVSLLMAGKDVEAREVAEATLRRGWDDGAHFTLAYLDMKVGNRVSANQHIDAVLNVAPNRSVAARRHLFGYIRDKDFFENYLDALHAAGLPEFSPKQKASGD